MMISVEEAAIGVIEGKYGNGGDCKKRISALGLDYDSVQTRVNQILEIKATSFNTSTTSSKVSISKG